MNPKGILVIDVFGFLLIALIVYLVSRQKLHVGFGLLWLLTTLGAMTLVSIAQLRNGLAPAVGALYPASALSLLAFAFIFVVLIFFSVKLTALSARQTRILQALALMDQETREAADVARDPGRAKPAEIGMRSPTS